MVIDEIVSRSRKGHGSAAEDLDPTGEIRKLTSLLDISQALSGTLNLTASLPSVLEILERHHSVVRASVSLVDDESRDLYVKAATGMDGHRTRTKPSESIIGRVIDSGKGIVVPQISHEPLLHDKTRKPERELSYICVPLTVNRKPVGALAVYLSYKRDRHYDRSLKFFRVVGSMIAQAVKVSRLAEAEKRRLVEENTHLRDELRDCYAFRHLIGNSAPI